MFSLLRGVAVSVAVLGALCAAAGCTATSSERPSSPPGTSAAGGSETPRGALPSGVVGATSVPTSVPNEVALRADVGMSSCAPHAGGWMATGSARNPRTKATTYKITVFFTSSRATVIGTARASVRVPPGGNRRWTASSAFHPAKPTLCVLRGVG
jgi:hypothetical protein